MKPIYKANENFSFEHFGKHIDFAFVPLHTMLLAVSVIILQQ